jgi:hypothetical protein
LIGWAESKNMTCAAAGIAAAATASAAAIVVDRASGAMRIVLPGVGRRAHYRGQRSRR